MAKVSKLGQNICTYSRRFKKYTIHVKSYILLFLFLIPARSAEENFEEALGSIFSRAESGRNFGGVLLLFPARKKIVEVIKLATFSVLGAEEARRGKRTSVRERKIDR